MFKKTTASIFDHNFGKCRPIFKILSLVGSQGNRLCMCDRDLHLTSFVLLHYLVKFENSKLYLKKTTPLNFHHFFLKCLSFAIQNLTNVLYLTNVKNNSPIPLHNLYILCNPWLHCLRNYLPVRIMECSYHRPILNVDNVNCILCIMCCTKIT